jgi:ATP-dependent exoDNAse (exonuclease V) beta subunit
MMELAFAHARPRDLWRRLRFVVDQCRAWEEAGGSTLRDYLQWVKLQSAPGSRVIETVLPETDDHAVRILTVHGAKGLEFPITILSGLTTALARRPNGVQVLFPGAAKWAVKLKKGLDTEDFKSAIPVEEQMDEHERLRLLYVAATRARDHLVVSVHRKHGAKPDATAAGLLHRAGWDETLVEVLDFGAAEPNPPLATSAVPVTAALPSLAEWESARAAALASGTRRLATSATQLAEAAARARDDVGLRKDPRDIDLPPWQKGRYGTAVGRAVHGVLQTVDLASGAGLADAAAAQAAAEGVLGREGVIASLCRSALASDIVQRAAARQHWREVYVGVPYGDAVLEGYIDLLYRDDDGLVVVDYKTDAWETEADLAGKVERYRVQLDAYALAVETVLDEKVVRSELLFLATTGDAHAVVL